MRSNRTSTRARWKSITPSITRPTSLIVNNALKGQPDLAAKSVEDLISDLNAVPEDIRTAVRNNGGGHANHSFFWKIMGPKAGGEPSGKLADDIKSTFGSFDAFKEKVADAGAKRSAAAGRG